MSYLLDTVVLSELRKPEHRRNANFAKWFDHVPNPDLHISVLTIFEAERGIERQRKIDPDFAQALTTWLETLLIAYGDRTLPMSVPIARRWARLSHRIGNAGIDVAMAATALEHGLTVATRNVAHFAPTGVAVFNPFELPSPAGG